MLVRVCAHCGQKNRVPVARLGDSARCGSCKQQLGPIDEPVAVSDEDFDAAIANAQVPVLVDFWAEWCGPCRMIEPEVKKVAKEQAGQALVLKVDTDRNPKLSRRFQVHAVPTLMILRGGQVLHRQAGAVDHHLMSEWLLSARGVVH
jgi:thioredoxin 2